MHRKLWRLCTALTITMMALAAPSMTFAGTQGTGCVESEHVLLWENTIGDTSDGNDTLNQGCGNIRSNADLDATNHTLSGLCKAGVKLQDDWEDCVSSVTVWLTSNTTFCLYENPFFDDAHDVFTISGPRSQYRVNVPSYIMDAASSWKIVNGGWLNC